MSVTFVRNWWILAFRGLIAVLLGLAAFFWPGGVGLQALALLVPLFGTFALIHGLFALGIAFMERGHYEGWWRLKHWYLPLLEGVVGIAAGVVTLSISPMTIATLLYIVAAWAIVNGLIELGAALWLRDVFVDESLLMVGGILSIIFGLILLFRPDAPPLAVLWLFGSFVVSLGVLFSIFAFRVRNLIQVNVDTSETKAEASEPKEAAPRGDTLQPVGEEFAPGQPQS